MRTAALLRRGLLEEGYAVDVAVDGPDGVWQATEFRYDVIILDVLLPGFDGFEVWRRLRSAGCWTRVLMLTARVELEERVRGLDSGADDYLAKPFSFDELFARLRALIRRGASERPAVLQVGDLQLDPATRRVWRGGGGARPVGQRILAARAVLALSRSGADPDPHSGARMGLRLRRRIQCCRPVCRVSAAQGRPPIWPDPAGDRQGRRLPAAPEPAAGTVT